MNEENLHILRKTKPFYCDLSNFDFSSTIEGIDEVFDSNLQKQIAAILEGYKRPALYKFRANATRESTSEIKKCILNLDPNLVDLMYVDHRMVRIEMEELKAMWSEIEETARVKAERLGRISHRTLNLLQLLRLRNVFQHYEWRFSQAYDLLVQQILLSLVPNKAIPRTAPAAVISESTATEIVEYILENFDYNKALPTKKSGWLSESGLYFERLSHDSKNTGPSSSTTTSTLDCMFIGRIRDAFVGWFITSSETTFFGMNMEDQRTDQVIIHGQQFELTDWVPTR